jgi:hypothetical protein
MPKERKTNVESNRPATPVEQETAAKSGQDGLRKTREDSSSREEIAQTKTSQGQSNRG